MTEAAIQQPKPVPSSGGVLEKLKRFVSGASPLQTVARLFAMGDLGLVISGLFTPDGKGKSYNSDKIKAGLSGFPNSGMWLVAQQPKPFDEALNQLGSLCDKALEDKNFSALEEAITPSDPAKRAVDWARRNGMKLGSLAFLPNGFFLMRSGMKRKSFGGEGEEHQGASGVKFNGGVSEMTHGSVNMLSYTLLAGLPDKTINFKEKYDYSKPEDVLELLARNRSRIASALDVATTGLGFLTAALDLLGRKVPLVGGLAQLFVSTCYLAGSAKLSEFDKQAEHAAKAAGITAEKREDQLTLMAQYTADMLKDKPIAHSESETLLPMAAALMAKTMMFNAEERDFFHAELNRSMAVAEQRF